tara:strand:- start:17877 stop:18731 length:855 start_codon:yes stop_codon:yes gene_type:complete
MAIRKHANNYASTLNGAITNVQTTIIVTSATGLPSIGAGEEYNLTLVAGSDIEIVTVTDDASSPTLTVTRGAEGTSGVAFADGAIVELRPTADSIDRKEDVLSGASLTSATVATGDLVLIQDIDDSNNLKTVTAQAIADLGGGGVGQSAFSASMSVGQSVATSTWTKLQFAVEDFDTNSDYDNATNYRFTPTVAGKYQINANIGFPNPGDGNVVSVSIYKNGTLYKKLVSHAANATDSCRANISMLVDANGSTDYFECYGWQSSGGNLTSETADVMHFSGAQVG